MSKVVTTPVAPGRKLLVYDGDCPMCTATAALLQRAGWIAPEQARSNADLSPADSRTVETAGIRNQMVVLDPVTRETRTGVDAILWILAENKGDPWWLRVLSLAPLRHLMGAAYQVVSYNRRVISPPAQRVRCDCEPDVTLARRLSLVAPLAVLSVLIAGLLGAAVAYGGGFTDWRAGALALTVAAGLGWLAMGLAAIGLLRGEQRLDYLAHLAVTAFVGAVVLLPAGLLAWWLPREANLTLAGVSILASFAIMLGMQRRRLAFLGLSRRWLWAWCITIPIGSVALLPACFAR
jgi:predicted DCC family thiol-disulfide oxidoreductase YuxK